MMRFGIPEYRLPRTLIRAEIGKIAALGVTLAAGAPLTPVLRPRASSGARASRPSSSSVGVSQGPRPRRSPRRRARRRRQGRRLPAERQPRLPHGPRPPRGRDRRRLRRLRRRAHRAAPRPRGGGSSALGGRDRRAHEGGLRLGARRAPRRRDRGDDRLARELRRDAGAAHDAGPRGVRGGEARGRRLPHRAAARRRFLGDGRLRRSSCGRASRSSTRPAASPRTTTTPTCSRSTPTPASSRSASAPTSSFLQARGRRRADARRHDPGRPARRSRPRAPGVFAGGDVAFGPRNLIEAVANGKRAARSIHGTSPASARALEVLARGREDPDLATTA